MTSIQVNQLLFGHQDTLVSMNDLGLVIRLVCKQISIEDSSKSKDTFQMNNNCTKKKCSKSVSLQQRWCKLIKSKKRGWAQIVASHPNIWYWNTDCVRARSSKASPKVKISTFHPNKAKFVCGMQKQNSNSSEQNTNISTQYPSFCSKRAIWFNTKDSPSIQNNSKSFPPAKVDKWHRLERSYKRSNTFVLKSQVVVGQSKIPSSRGGERSDSKWALLLYKSWILCQMRTKSQSWFLHLRSIPLSKTRYINLPTNC